VKTDESRQVAVFQRVHNVVERLPETVRLHMKQGEFYLRPLRSPVGDNRPVTGKAEGQFAGNRHDFLSETAFFGYFQ
jgi:hypothetical protein